MTPTPIPCPNFGNALDTLLAARASGLAASYHPSGGDTALFMKPVTHTVFVAGDETTVERFVNEQTIQ
jgi:hypothetical protein